MADERVVIKIEVKSDDKDIDRTRRKLERLAGARDRDRKSEGLASRNRSKRLRREFRDGKNEFDKVSRLYKKSFDSFDKMIKMTGAGMLKFLAFTAKAVALEMAAMGTAMMLTHLTFATGRLIMKAYNGMMKMVAASMAGVAIAAGTMAAALREQQAAMYAFSGRGQATEFGSALNQTRVQMRALTMDADLASVGVQNLTTAYAEVVKTGGRFTAASRASLKGLMDFASAGMDMKEGTKQAGALIATLQDTKKSYGDVVSAGKNFSPQLKKALEAYEKGKGEKTKAGLTAAIRSGELAKLGGVDGQFGAVSGTLIGTLKAEFNLLLGQFADFGQTFLGPMKKEAKESFAIITRGIQSLSGQVTEFGKSGFIDKISVMVDKMTNFVVRTLRDFLSDSVGIFERIGDWWDRFTDGWNEILDVLRPFIDGARVFEKVLKNAWLPVWEQIKENMYTFNNELLKNRPEIEEFGTNIGNLLVKVMEYFAEARKLFFQALPFINKVIKGFTSLIELFTSFLGGFVKLTGGIGGMGGVASLIGLIGLSRGMKNTKGYFTHGQSMSGIREVANMNVRSGTVIVNGRDVARYGPRGSGGSSGIVKGSNTINTHPPFHRGPFMGPPGSSRGAGSAGTGLASRGAGPSPLTTADRTQLRNQFGGSVRAGKGPNGGHLITSGPNKGKEILTQRVRGKDVQYMYGGRGTGAANYSQKNLNDKTFKSGVTVAGDQRMKGNTKIVDSTGRIITRRERLARAIGEGQRHSASGFGSDGRPKSMLDRMLGKNTGAGGFIGRAADRYRNRLVNNSNYLGPSGPPINPRTGRPFTPSSQAYKAWELSSTRAYGQGTFDPNSMRGRFFNGRLYNNWLSPTSDLSGKGPYERRGLGRALQNARLASRNARASRLGGMVFGNANRKGLQGSAMGGMGVGMGLGALASSGLVSEEAQGFLSAGAMVGMINPLAGLAIGLGGTALTSKTVGGGALSGSAAGAAIGTMIAPGFGTAAGAIIGAAVGGLMGGLNKVKDEKNKARKAFESAFDNLVTQNLIGIQQRMIESGGVGKSEIVKAAKRGGRIDRAQSEILNKYRDGGSSAEIVEMLAANQSQYGLTDEQIKDMRKRPEEIGKVIDKVSSKEKARNHLTDIYAKRLDALTKLTGVSEQEVEKMAMTMGVDLYDSTVDFNEVVEKLGVSVVKTRDQLRGMQMDLALSGLDQFSKKLGDLDAPKILDEQARAFRDMYDAADGVITDSEFSEFIKGFVPNMLNAFGGGLQGTIKQMQLFGVGGTEFSRKEGDITSPFYGMENLFVNSLAGQAYQQMLGTTYDRAIGIAGGQLNAKLFESEGVGRFVMDTDRFTEQFKLLSPAMQKQLADDIEDNRLLPGDMQNFTRNDFAVLLERYGMDANKLGLRSIEDDDELNIALDKMPQELKDTYGEIIKLFGSFFDTRDEKVPEWMTDNFINMIAQNKDTMTPRGKGVGDTTSSRLSQTMSRHAQMDSMLTGKRTVTSAYRTTGLGSINSDHVTGRAYDLVGQNLGAYQRLTTANGGFAEFHGSNASRHLHVVPRLGAYGDTVSPKIAIMPAQKSSGRESDGGITIMQTITGGQNASPNEIAEAAVRKMKLALENERQRR